MPKLYLVGVTEDRSGLVLSKSSRSKGGDSILEIDADVLEAIAEIRRYRSGSPAAHHLSSPALPTRRADSGGETRLSPREIQDRLRHGETIKAVAKRAGIDEWRVEIYAAPVLAEQGRVVSEARVQTLAKRGAGPSGLPLGDAVVSNLVDKKVGISRQEFEAGWTAYETLDGGWVVRFEYVSRGRPQRAEWEYDEASRTLTASNRLATVLGWRDPKARRRTPRLPDAAPVPEKPAARRSPATRPGRKKKAAPKKAPAKKPAPKKAPARKPAPKKAPAKKPAPKKAPARKPVPKKAPAKKPAPKKAPARKPAPKKAPAKKPVPKKAPAKKPAPRKAPPKKVPARKPATPKRPAPKRSAPKKAPAKKKAPARATAARSSTSGRTSTVRRAPASGRSRRSEPVDDLATRPFRLLDALLAEEETADVEPGDESLEPPAWVGESARRRSSAPAAARPEPRPARSGGTGPNIKAQRAGSASSPAAPTAPGESDVVDLDEYRSATSGTSASSSGTSGSGDAAPEAAAASEAPRRRGLLRRQRPLRAR